MLTDLVREDLRSCRAGGIDGPVLDLEVQYCAGALMSVLTWRMDHDVPLAADAVSGIIGRLKKSGFNASSWPPRPLQST